jgi:hypothetical protein
VRGRHILGNSSNWQARRQHRDQRNATNPSRERHTYPLLDNRIESWSILNVQEFQTYSFGPKLAYRK